jgi:DNA repair photolyase
VAPSKPPSHPPSDLPSDLPGGPGGSAPPSPRVARPRSRARLIARGSADNPANRFERLAYAEDPEFVDESGDGEDGGAPAFPTRYYRDPSRTLLARNESPDIGFDVSLNPYRGCEHGCVYCYARPTHEYLGLSAGLDFETHILVKEDAPALLEKALGSPRWVPETVAVGAVTDPYQPVERRLRITRRCLEVFAKYRNPCAIITKGGLVTRDVDVLGELAAHGAVAVNVSITTLDDRIRRAMEPRASSPKERLRAVEVLAAAGIPVGVVMAPIVPGLTDSEIPALVEAAAHAGARTVRPIVLRLPHGVADLFEAWLERHFPERKAKVMSRVRALRGGRRNDPRFHSRMRGEGVFADSIASLFALACRRAGVSGDLPELSTAAFRRPGGEQLALL